MTRDEVKECIYHLGELCAIMEDVVARWETSAPSINRTIAIECMNRLGEWFDKCLKAMMALHDTMDQDWPDGTVKEEEHDA